MERFVTKDIVVIEFNFTNLSATRRRPALILASLSGDDLIVCEITSVIRNDNYVVSLENKDLEFGKLKINSIIRPNRILTIENSKIIYRFGKLKEEKFNEVLGKLRGIFKI